MTRPLGHHQLTALSALARLSSGTWSPDCAWRLHSVAYTARVLNTLVEREYATRSSATGRYAITEQGLNRLGWFTCGNCTRLTRSPVFEQPCTSERQVRCSWCVAPEQAPPARESGLGGTRVPVTPVRKVTA
ncbi:hypothetical protein [Streptomyces violascens]|uniref:hypothetical protein n=1 Tax=Streptomyces violascens TaxID=67381 RepID=UPI001673F900|nr:hypothetical protein [Streptomyces violascens]GGU49486.1 hypothetical protein GCM10010289_82510 [Streptomyces violascens]